MQRGRGRTKKGHRDEGDYRAALGDVRRTCHVIRLVQAEQHAPFKDRIFETDYQQKLNKTSFNIKLMQQYNRHSPDNTENPTGPKILR